MFKNFLRRSGHQSTAHIFPDSPRFRLGSGFSIGKYRNIQVFSTDADVEIGQNVAFREFCNILIYPKAKLEIKDNVFFNNYCSINCLGNISVGENTLFGEGVKIYDHNHKFSYQGDRLNVERDAFKIGTVVIGKNCWIASNVTILPNVVIGDNVVIGAHNLIYKSVPANSIIKAKVDYL